MVFKSLLAWQLVYIVSPLPTSSGHLRDINNLRYQFLWDGKRDKIKQVEMINDYATGGLKMLDIQIFNRALKAKWIIIIMIIIILLKFKFNRFLNLHNPHIASLIEAGCITYNKIHYKYINTLMD